MNDLINRSALHEAGYEVFEKFVDFPEARRAINQLEQLILSAPAVDAVPVRHGRWEYRAIDTPNLGRRYEMYCTACGKTPDPKKDFYYCPMCGAKMDKKGE